MEDRTDYNIAMSIFYGILSPYMHPFVVNAIEFVKELKPDIICTGHGPVLDTNIQYVLQKYDEWCAKEHSDKKQVVLAFVSSYVYTRENANTIYERLNSKEDISVSIFEVDADNKQETINAILKSDGFLLGTPTFLGDALSPIAELSYSMHPPMVKGKVASAFGSYGWSGEGVPNIMARLEQLKLKTVEGLRIRFKPSDEDLQKAVELADRFAQALNGK